MGEILELEGIEVEGLRERYPFVFHTHSGSPTGYSHAAMTLIRAFMEQGLEMHYQSIGADSLEEQTSMDPVVDDMRKVEPDFALPQILFSIPPLFWANSGAYKVGWSMIEVDGIDQRWVRACNAMNEIWVPTKSQVKYFADSGVEVPIYLVPLGLDTRKVSPSWIPMRWHGPGRFRFFACGYWQLRKRWDTLIHAFAEEFEHDPDVFLVIKTLTHEGEGVVPEMIKKWVGEKIDNKVAVFDGAMPWWELTMMQRCCHAFVLPTSGEGWGYPPADALACGLPVITTDCMGTGEVLRGKNRKPYPGVLLLPARKEITGVTHPYYEGRNWWVVETAHLRQAMRAVYENYSEWKAAALKGSEKIRKEKSVEVSVEHVKARLKAIYELMGL